MSLLRFFSLLKIVKEQQGSESSKEKGTPFFLISFTSASLLIFASQFLLFFLTFPKSLSKKLQKGSNFSIFSLFRNYSDSDTRTSSERSNSTCKESDLDILGHPRVRGIKRAAVLSYLSDIASFLKRVFGLIIRITVNLRKYRETKNKKYWERLFGPKVPLYLLYAIQRE